MSCSQLSTIKSMTDERQYCKIKEYFQSLLPSSKITASNFAAQNGLDFQQAQNILQELVKEELLKYNFCVRCPACGLLLISVESVASIEKELYCYHCDETVEISTDDVEVIYTFNQYPFVTGQQSNFSLELEESAARQNDSLTQLLKNGGLDINAAFFAPSPQDYQELQNAYQSIFEPQANTKAKGDTLENFTIMLFNLCKHFRVAPIRQKVNQLDCYVRNTVFIPGMLPDGRISSFIIECKNENDKPKAEHMNKLHSILHNSGNKFGIIVSKCQPPKTFVSLANQIFLRDEIIIIALDAADLRNIVFKKANLLECMSRKIEEVKLNATTDLVKAGLYDA